MGAFVVITTVGTEEQANLIASELVARRHASCVNIVTGVRSVYRWQGKICRDAEFLLIVKTLESEYAAVQAAIQERLQWAGKTMVTLPIRVREAAESAALALHPPNPYP